MRKYNVIQAAAYIGCDPKTVRRMLKRGQLTAERTERGWLAIPGGQVEYAKIKWEEERAQFARPGLPRESLVSLSRDVQDSIWRLEGRIAQLEETTALQEKRIAALEERLSRDSLPVPTPHKDASHVPAQPRTPLSSITIPADLPDGTLHSTDFAASLGISKTVMEGWLKNGIRGEQLEREKVPITPGRNSNYFTPDQQRAAIELLRKHGKI
jgi:hypothetical protein